MTLLFTAMWVTNQGSFIYYENFITVKLETLHKSLSYLHIISSYQESITSVESVAVCQKITECLQPDF